MHEIITNFICASFVAIRRAISLQPIALLEIKLSRNPHLIGTSHTDREGVCI